MIFLYPFFVGSVVGVFVGTAVGIFGFKNNWGLFATVCTAAVLGAVLGGIAGALI